MPHKGLPYHGIARPGPLRAPLRALLLAVTREASHRDCLDVACAVRRSPHLLLCLGTGDLCLMR